MHAADGGSTARSSSLPPTVRYSRVVSRVGFSKSLGLSIEHRHSAQHARRGDLGGQHRASPDAAREGKFLDTGVRHFLHRALGSLLRLAGRMIAAPCIAALVAALCLASIRTAPSVATPFTAVDLPAVAAAAHVEDRAAKVAPTFSKAVVSLVGMHRAPGAPFLTASPPSSLQSCARRTKKVARQKQRSKIHKYGSQRPKPKTEAQKTEDAIRDTAAVFTCAHETAEDCATECERRLGEIELDLDYRRVAYGIWTGRTGRVQPLIAAMAELITENERHQKVMTDLFQRFEALGALDDFHEHIETPEKYLDIVRTLFGTSSAR